MAGRRRASSASTSGRSRGAPWSCAVSDGAELGSAVHEYAHGVIERELPASGAAPAAAVGAAGPRGLDRRPARGGAGGRRRGRRRARAGHRDRAPTSPPRRRCRCSPTARRCAGCDDLRERPHAYPKLWKHHAAGGQAERINAVARERGEPWLARYGGADLVGVGVRQGRCRSSRRTPRSTSGWTASSRRADWIVWQLCGRETRNTCTAGYKGIFQDGGYPSEDYLRALDERFANFVSEKIGGPLDAARRARRRPDARRPRSGPGCRRGSPSRSATWTHMSPRPPRGRSKQARCSPSWELRRATS